MENSADGAGRYGCVVLQRLTELRSDGFAAYQEAHQLLAILPNGQAGHEDALKVFEIALQSLLVKQRKWEEHVAEHHLG